MSESTNYFEKMNKVNVSEHIEKKGKFSYLSWPFAVQQLGLADPTATWDVVKHEGLPYLKTECGYFVEVAVVVQGVKKTQIHPVLDASNKVKASPSAFDINTSIQRCLVKAIALHGLGLYIYAGEDLPEEDKVGDELKKEFPNGQALSGPHKPTDGAWESMTPDMRTYLLDLSGEVRSLLNKGDFRGAAEHIEEQKIDNDTKVALWTRFDSKERSALKKAFEEIRKAA